MKPWQKDSSDPTFNEFYTTAEQCDIIFSDMIPIMHKENDYKPLKVCCPCDGEQSEIVKYFKLHCSDWDIDYFNDLDFNSEEARGRMLKADVIITNPPFRMKEWRPFVEWLIANNKKFFIWGPLLYSCSQELIKYVTEHAYIYSNKEHKHNVWAYNRPDGTQKPAITFFYTSYKVPTLEYKYKPAKKEQSYNNIPVYDRLYNIPLDYLGWMYVPVTSLVYLQPFEVDATKDGVPGKFVRVCLRRKSK